MVKKAGMAIVLGILLLITSNLAPNAHAVNSKKAEMSIYNRCARTSLQLFVFSEQRNCIVAQPSPQKLKRESAKKTEDNRSTQQKTISTSTQNPTPTQTSIQQPTPTTSVVTPTSISATVTPTPVAEQTQLNADVLFAMVNEVRVQNGLTPFEKDGPLCEIAASRAPELYDEIFVNYNMHAGFYNRNLPYWATENMIYQNTEQQALNWWLNSPVHRSAIFGNYKYSCCACQGKACAQIFTNYLPK